MWVSGGIKGAAESDFMADAMAWDVDGASNFIFIFEDDNCSIHEFKVNYIDQS
jgi:hypothetical protein